MMSSLTHHRNMHTQAKKLEHDDSNRRHYHSSILIQHMKIDASAKEICVLPKKIREAQRHSCNNQSVHQPLGTDSYQKNWGMMLLNMVLRHPQELEIHRPHLVAAMWT